ncbi:MAG: exodeoxyribonuclease VII small subunit [Porphyromonadaceae bacterium]|nr:exodeoxyribonuclease VII small subunit [Porphyromonadaceae bacterium]MCD8287346.1 exodeoxyribonuclease VII small subunit [Porphyromonadaceae bacterium]
MKENEKPTYAEAIAELESIVAHIEEENCEIESIRELTLRAMELLKYCQEKLFETDESLKQLLETLNEKKEQSEK